MAFSVTCSDLGVRDCDWVASGETAADVVDEVRDYLRKDKGIKLPRTEVILGDDASLDPLGTDLNPATATIVRRLREALNVEGDSGAGPGPGPAIRQVLDR